MNHKKAKLIYDEICEVLRKHGAFLSIDGDGCDGTIEMCDGLLPPKTKDMSPLWNVDRRIIPRRGYVRPVQ